MIFSDFTCFFFLDIGNFYLLSFYHCQLTYRFSKFPDFFHPKNKFVPPPPHLQNCFPVFSFTDFCLIFIISFHLFALGLFILFCFFFLWSCNRLLIWDLSSLPLEAFSGMNFLLINALVLSHKLWKAVFYSLGTNKEYELCCFWMELYMSVRFCR